MTIIHIYIANANENENKHYSAIITIVATFSCSWNTFHDTQPVNNYIKSIYSLTMYITLLHIAC